MDYQNPTPVVVSLIRVKMFGFNPAARADTMLLAIRRGILPNIGGLALPGGYVDKLESAEAAAVRETDEEVGLATRQELWKPVYTRTNANNRLLIFMLYDRFFWVDHVRQAAKLRVPNEEIQSIEFIDDTAESCFSFHTEIIQTPSLWLPKSGEQLEEA